MPLEIYVILKQLRLAGKDGDQGFGKGSGINPLLLPVHPFRCFFFLFCFKHFIESWAADLQRLRIRARATGREPGAGGTHPSGSTASPTPQTLNFSPQTAAIL